jgi:hypothetical protein
VKPREPDKKPPREARMINQIQEGLHTHYGSSVVDAADPERGVTAVELERNMIRALTNAQQPVPNPRPPGDRREQLPARYVPPCHGGFSEQSKRVRERTVPGGGIPADRRGDINELRVCFDSRTLARHNCQDDDDYVRLDVENKAGHNLRFLE